MRFARSSPSSNWSCQKVISATRELNERQQRDAGSKRESKNIYVTQKSLFSLPSCQVISRRKDMRRRSSDYLHRIWRAPTMFNRGNQVKLFEIIYDYVNWFFFHRMCAFPTQNVSIIEHHLISPHSRLTNNALMLLHHHTNQTTLVPFVCITNERDFLVLLFCMLMCVGDYIIIFWCCSAQRIYYYFFALIATTQNINDHFRWCYTRTQKTVLCSIEMFHIFWCKTQQTSSKKLSNRIQGIVCLSPHTELSSSQTNHNYVNSHITMQAASNNEPVHSSSSKDYVNQAVINENQQKQRSSAHHKHRKTHKSSSHNDKRYHSGKWHNLCHDIVAIFRTSHTYIHSRPTHHHVGDSADNCVYLDFLKLTMTETLLFSVYFLLLLNNSWLTNFVCVCRFSLCCAVADSSEVRQEAVQQALAALKNRPKESILMPSKRSSIFKISSQRCEDNDSGEQSFASA